MVKCVGLNLAMMTNTINYEGNKHVFFKYVNISNDLESQIYNLISSGACTVKSSIISNLTESERMQDTHVKPLCWH